MKILNEIACTRIPDLIVLNLNSGSWIIVAGICNPNLQLHVTLILQQRCFCSLARAVVAVEEAGSLCRSETSTTAATITTKEWWCRSSKIWRVRRRSICRGSRSKRGEQGCSWLHSPFSMESNLWSPSAALGMFDVLQILWSDVPFLVSAFLFFFRLNL